MLKLKMKIVAVSVSIFAVFMGCNRQEQAREDVKESREEVTEAQREVTQEQREVVIARLRQDFVTLDQNIDSLGNVSIRGGAEVENTFRQSYEQLQQQRDRVESQLDQLENATDEAVFPQARQQTETALDSLKSSYQALEART